MSSERRWHPARFSTWASLVSASRVALPPGLLTAGGAHLPHSWADGTGLFQTRVTLGTAVDGHALSWNTRTRGRRDAFSQTMVNFGDAQYISYFRIGSQVLAGMLDTGSFELVVFGADCRTCGVAAHYNPSLSTTFRSGRLVSQQAYGSGNCYSIASADIMQIGPFSETKQSFWTVQQAKMPILANAAFEAIIGLGPPEAPAADAWKAVTAIISNVTSYYDMAEKAPEVSIRQVDKRLEIADEMSVKTTLLDSLDVTTFSVCLGSATRANGIFVWNDLDALNQPNIFTRIPVTGHHTWSTNLTNPALVHGNVTGGITMGNADRHESLGCSSNTGCSVILDTGMSLIAAPKLVVDRLREAVSRLQPDCSNISELPDLVFDLGGRSFSLPPEAYVAEVEGSVPEYLARSISLNTGSAIPPRCQLLLVESIAVTKSGPLWIFGMPFFKKYYTTFHIGESREERAFYIAEAGEDCSPGSPGEEWHARTDPKSSLRRVELQKVHLPQTARIAMTEQFARL